MNILRISVDPEVLATGAFGAGAVVRVESSATGGGAGFAELGTVAVVAGQMEATYYHAAGTTSTWYRTRYSNATNTLQSEYGDEFQSEGTVAYATVADFTSTLEATPSASRVERIAECLEEASALIDGAIGWDFYRHPVTSTEQRLFDGPTNGHRLCVHSGIVSVTTLEVRDSAASTSWTTVAAGDFFLEPRYPLAGEPYTHLSLTRVGTTSAFTAGIATIRVTGVFGHATVPTRVKRATVALARQIYRADATTPGGMAGESELPMGVIPRGWPDDTYRCIRYYQTRDLCWFG